MPATVHYSSEFPATDFPTRARRASLTGAACTAIAVMTVAVTFVTFSYVALSCIGLGQAHAAETPPPSNCAPGEPCPQDASNPPSAPKRQHGGMVVVPQGPDPLGRDADRSLAPPGIGLDIQDAMPVTGNPDAVIRGDGAILPSEKTETSESPETSGAAEEAKRTGGGVQGASASSTAHSTLKLDAHGFVHGELHVLKPDSGMATSTTLLLRELELDLDAAPTSNVHLRFDFNVSSDRQEQLFSLTGLQNQIVTLLVEQAFVAWHFADRLDLRVGRMNARSGVEGEDVVERMVLSRSHLAQLFLPRQLTAAELSVQIIDELEAYILVTNGWESVVDNNTGKTFGVGLPHRFGPPVGHAVLYEGNVEVLLGAERSRTPSRIGRPESHRDDQDLRLLVDYSARVQLAPTLEGLFEFVYGREHGLGRVPSTGEVDVNRWASWYGGLVTVQTAAGGLGDNSWISPLRLGVRVEYLHDGALTRRLPAEGGPLPDLTTLLGTALTVRYQLASGLELALCGLVDFERGDVPHVSIARNEDAFPNIFNLRKWFVTLQGSAALIGSF